jgi:hypothetical protein
VQRRSAALVLQQRIHQLHDERDLVLHRRQVHRRAPQDVLLQQQRWARVLRQAVYDVQVAAHDGVVQRSAPLAVPHCRICALQCRVHRTL